MKDSIYLNCAASSFPKPEAVLQCIQEVLTLPPGEAGRSNSGNCILRDRCRNDVADLIGCNSSEVHFSSGATESANLIIAGLDLKDAHVIATATEHNAVLRPLYNHRDHPEISIAPCDADGWVDPSAVEALIRSDTRCLFVNHCSNVTGCVQNIRAMGRIAQRHNLLLIVDASQSIGCTEIDVIRDHIGILIFTGHKNLFGIAGIGGAYIRAGAPVRIVKTGGTGTDSLWLTLPEDYTDREPGTPNTIGLTSLAAGIAYIRDTGLDAIQQELCKKRCILTDGLRKIPGIHVFHGEPDAFAGPVVSFVCEGIAPGDYGYILKESCGITVRTGYHCCPLIHSSLGCELGTIRVSFSVLTPDEHLNRFLSVVREIQEGAAPL